MRVEELTSGLLDYWVARAEVAAGYFTFDSKEHDKPLIQLFGDTCGTVFDVAKPHHYGPFRGPGCGTFAPSTDWSYGGGPIIEREKLYLRDPDPPARHVGSGFDNKWMAAKVNHAKREYEHNQFGETPLIAATWPASSGMKCQTNAAVLMI